MKIDIVYLCIQHTTNKHMELRYSLRSLQEYVYDYRNVYVVGHLPNWCQNVIHISRNDIYKQNKDANIIRKIISCCHNDDISDPFLFVNDDHFFSKRVKANEFPFYYFGDLYTKTTNPKYKHRIYKTKELLLNKNLPIRHYDIHTPILIYKKRFLEAFHDFDYVETYIVMKSWYANHWLTVDKSVEIDDCKFYSSNRGDLDKLKIKVLQRPCFSTSDSISRSIVNLFHCLYTYPSKYEK